MKGEEPSQKAPPSPVMTAIAATPGVNRPYPYLFGLDSEGQIWLWGYQAKEWIKVEEASW